MIWAVASGAIRGRGGVAIGIALEEMSSGYRRQAIDVLHGENHRTVHHAVNQETMLLGVDVRRRVTVGIVVMERGRRDDPDQILNRELILRCKGGRPSRLGLLSKRRSRRCAPQSHNGSAHRKWHRTAAPGQCRAFPQAPGRSPTRVSGRSRTVWLALPQPIRPAPHRPSRIASCQIDSDSCAPPLKVMGDSRFQQVVARHESFQTVVHVDVKACSVCSFFGRIQ